MSARETNWWQRNWKWVVPVGIVAPILVCGGFVTLLVALVFGMMRGTGAYQDAVAAARADTAVVAALGSPIEEGLFVTGEIEINGGSGFADLAIPISGPRGSATLYVTAHKHGPGWSFEKLEVVVHESGQWIHLLDEPAVPRGIVSGSDSSR